jgi:hypothetical protein
MEFPHALLPSEANASRAHFLKIDATVLNGAVAKNEFTIFTSKVKNHETNE